MHSAIPGLRRSSDEIVPDRSPIAANGRLPSCTPCKAPGASAKSRFAPLLITLAGNPGRFLSSDAWFGLLLRLKSVREQSRKYLDSKKNFNLTGFRLARMVP